MNFNVYFANPKGEEIGFNFIVNDTEIGRRWFVELMAQLGRDASIKDPNRLYNFPNSNWDEKRFCDQLNQCIDLINNPDEVITDRAYIGMGQDGLNVLHHYFETLKGTPENPTEFIKSLSIDKYEALSMMNTLIHRMETFLRARENGVQGLYPRVLVSFKNAPWQALFDRDFDLFTMQHEFGEVYLNYAEVGKTLMSVWRDKDDVVGDSNIKPQRFFNAAFSIPFFETTKEQEDRQLTAFYKWWDENEDRLSNLGFTKGDPKNAINHICIAKLNTKLPRELIIDMIATHQTISRVTLGL